MCKRLKGYPGALLGGGLLCLSVSAAIRLLLANVWRLMGETSQLGQIFSQLRHASVRPPLLLLLGVFFGFCLWAKLRARKGKNVCLSVVAGIFLWVLLLVTGLLLTYVNGVLFVDMLPVFVNISKLLSAGLGIVL